MRFGILISIVTLLNISVLKTIDCKNCFIVNIILKSYSNPKDILYNGKRCEFWGIDYCDPMFEIQIYGRNRFLILNKMVNYQRNAKYIKNVFSNIFKTDRDLSIILLKVRVSDHDMHAKNLINVFTETFHPVNLTNFSSSGPLQAKYNIQTTLDYKLTIYGGADYYGNKCEIYCKNTNYYKCNMQGEKICFSGYYGSLCDKECVENRNYSCDNDGNKLCKPNFLGKNCELDCNLICSPNHRCILDSSSNITCVCPPGKLGKSCQKQNLTKSTTTTNLPIQKTSSPPENTASEGKLYEDQIQRITIIYGGIIGLFMLLCFIMLTTIIVLKMKKQKNYHLQHIPSVHYHPNDKGVLFPTHTSPNFRDSSAYSLNQYATISDDRALIKPELPVRNVSMRTQNYTDDSEDAYELPKWVDSSQDMCTVQTYASNYSDLI